MVDRPLNIVSACATFSIKTSKMKVANCSYPLSSLSASASKILALIGRIDRSLDIEARFRRNLKVGTRRIIHPIVRAIELGRQHATDDGHALGGICTKVVRAGGDDPNAELAPMALAGEGLDLGVEVRVVLDGHGWLLEMMVRNEVRMS